MTVSIIQLKTYILILRLSNLKVRQAFSFPQKNFSKSRYF
nr:MAG TPA: hypothetical protein [Caudoviricetes sp.]